MWSSTLVLSVLLLGPDRVAVQAIEGVQDNSVTMHDPQAASMVYTARRMSNSDRYHTPYHTLLCPSY